MVSVPLAPCPTCRLAIAWGGLVFRITVSPFCDHHGVARKCLPRIVRARDAHLGPGASGVPVARRGDVGSERARRSLRRRDRQHGQRQYRDHEGRDRPPARWHARQPCASQAPASPPPRTRPRTCRALHALLGATRGIAAQGEDRLSPPVPLRCRPRDARSRVAHSGTAGRRSRAPPAAAPARRRSPRRRGWMDACCRLPRGSGRGVRGSGGRWRGRGTVPNSRVIMMRTL